MNLVLVNTGSLPNGMAALLRVIAVAAFLAGLIATRSSRASASDLPMTGQPPSGGFSRGYSLVTAGEAVAITGGLAVLDTVLHASRWPLSGS